MATQILLMRHEDHKNNQLLPEAFAQAVERGKKLKEAGFKIDGVVTSPQWRCIQTCLAVLQGYGTMVPLTMVEPHLGDIVLDKAVPDGWLAHLKEVATKEYGDTSDANLARAMVEHEEFHEVAIRRAQEGGNALIRIAMANEGKTVLVCSHGVARIEPSLRWLASVRGAQALDTLGDLFLPGELRNIYLDELRPAWWYRPPTPAHVM